MEILKRDYLPEDLEKEQKVMGYSGSIAVQDRLMIGSDWPVCRLAGEYPEVMKIVEDLINPADAEKILGSNALEFYGIEE